MVTNETATITLQEDGVDNLSKKVTFHTGEKFTGRTGTKL